MGIDIGAVETRLREGANEEVFHKLHDSRSLAEKRHNLSVILMEEIRFLRRFAGKSNVFLTPLKKV